MTSVEVNRRAAQRVASGHPWIFASDVVDRHGAPPGAAVRVMDPQKRVLGTAHHSSTSKIALRMLSARVEPIDAAFFRARLERAAAYRGSVVRDTTAYRVVYGEGDLLPALIVDRYGDYFVLQTLDQGMDAAKGAIVEAIEAVFHPAAVVERNEAAVRAREGLSPVSGVLRGEVPEEVEFTMNGLRWGARLLSGQKTGAYLDQRENYLAARRYGRGAALDCFCYAGGFALHLAAAGQRVEAVDSSAEALELGRRNAALNGLEGVEFRQADVFDVLAQYNQARRRFGTIVLDPPAFAKSRAQVASAARGYKEINLRALRMLERDGVLVTCSCSHHLSEAELLQVAAEAGLDAGRQLRVLERRTQALDHPILLTAPETHYLKCLVLQVM